jgi:hypothetical protein
MPTAVETSTPSEAMHASTPTEEPTPTSAPAASGELPLSGFERILPVIQSVEPEAYVETAPCADPSMGDVCVTAVDFCPEGQECPDVLWILNRYQAQIEFFGDERTATEWIEDDMRTNPNMYFDEKYEFDLFRNVHLEEFGTAVLLGPSMRARFGEATGWPQYNHLNVAAYPITDEIHDALQSWGLLTFAPK